MPRALPSALSVRSELRKGSWVAGAKRPRPNYLGQGMPTFRMFNSVMGQLPVQRQRYFTVRYAGQNGRIERRDVKAATEADAVAQLNVNRTSVRSVTRNYYQELNALLPDAAPPLSTQARILAVFTAQVEAGSNPSATFDQLLQSYPEFAHRATDVAKTPRVSEKLAALNFDPQLLLLAEVGEETGLIAQALGDATEKMIARQQLLSELKWQLAPSAGLTFVGVATLLALPPFMVDPIDEIVSVKEIRFASNFATDILMAIGRIYSMPSAWILTAALLAGAVVLRRQLWPYLNRLPMLSSIEAFFQISAAYRFITAFAPLFERGVGQSRILALLKRYARKKELTAYSQMEDHLAVGGSLATAFESDYWHPILRDSMRGFDPMTKESKLILLSRVQPLMAHTVKSQGNLVASTLSALGTSLSVGITLLVFFGMTLPMTTVTVGIGGG